MSSPTNPVPAAAAVASKEQVAVGRTMQTKSATAANNGEDSKQLVRDRENSNNTDLGENDGSKNVNNEEMEIGIRIPTNDCENRNTTCSSLRTKAAEDDEKNSGHDKDNDDHDYDNNHDDCKGFTSNDNEIEQKKVEWKLQETMTTSTQGREITTTTIKTPTAPSPFFNDIPVDTIQHYISPYLEIQDIFNLLLSTKYLYRTFTDCNIDEINSITNVVHVDSRDGVVIAQQPRGSGAANDRNSNSTIVRFNCGDKKVMEEQAISIVQEGEDVLEVFLEEVKKEELIVAEERIHQYFNDNNGTSKLKTSSSEAIIACVEGEEEEKEDVVENQSVINSTTNTTTTSSVVRSSFADRFWKERCKQRWKSISFDHIDHSSEEGTTATSTQQKQLQKQETSHQGTAMNKWYREYKYRHMIDQDAKEKIKLICKLDSLGQSEDKCQQESQGGNNGADDDDELSENKEYKCRKALLWSNLVQKGRHVWDFIIELARNELAENVETSRNKGQQDLEQKPKSLVSEEILEGIHRFEICQEFQRLSVMERKKDHQMDLYEEDEEYQLAEPSQNQDERNDEGESSPSTTTSATDTLEYGAILIAKFYQNAREIIADYDVKYNNTNDGQLLSLEGYVYREIEGMSKFIQNRLIERRIREEQIEKVLPTSVDSAPLNNNGNVRTDQWPMQWILEEMKVLFCGPSQQRGNNVEVVNNFTSEPTISKPLSFLYSTLKMVDTSPFLGNEHNYYSHHNSLIQHILQSRKGIPISLSVLYAAIVRRVSGGVDMEAVGLPGHFMLSTKITSPSSINDENQQQQVFIDVFHGGAILTKQQCQIMIVSRYNIPWDDAFIEPIQKTEVWCRMLRNLVNCHHRKIISSGNGMDMFLDSLGEPAEFGDLDRKMMNAVRVLISLGFRLTRLPLDMCNHDESFTEIIMRL